MVSLFPYPSSPPAFTSGGTWTPPAAPVLPQAIPHWKNKWVQIHASAPRSLPLDWSKVPWVISWGGGGEAPWKVNIHQLWVEDFQWSQYATGRLILPYTLTCSFSPGSAQRLPQPLLKAGSEEGKIFNVSHSGVQDAHIHLIETHSGNIQTLRPPQNV